MFQNHSIDWVWNKLIENFRLVVWNKELKDSLELSTLNLHDIFNLKVRIVGGKGGFGATMRSQKPKNPMTTNFDACRDLSGRRLRNVNAIRQLEEWQKKKTEEEKKIEEEVKDYQNNQKQIHAAIHANTYKIDDKYIKQMEISTNNISNSVVLGKKSLKRKHQDLLKMKTEGDGDLKLNQMQSENTTNMEMKDDEDIDDKIYSEFR